ncbi:uncharacterized protein LOC119355933 isoform X1 [Triticum dicoccoides]|uniref:uncharacterized protein LOC119355933 isoform X1 n=2 Tax=Triticum dicoccoides TaxID=85692 RepID=UPI000E7AF210|nr:uncharacterized protein LOC119355933 isoform X1 [Triticum dicoccoides]
MPQKYHAPKKIPALPTFLPPGPTNQHPARLPTPDGPHWIHRFQPNNPRNPRHTSYYIIPPSNGRGAPDPSIRSAAAAIPPRSPEPSSRRSPRITRAIANNPPRFSFLVSLEGRLALYTPGHPTVLEFIDDPQLVQAIAQMDNEALVPNPLENLAAYHGPLPQIQYHAPLPPLQVQHQGPLLPPPQVQHQAALLEDDDDPIRDVSKLFKEDDDSPALDMTDHVNDLAEAVGDGK